MEESRKHKHRSDKTNKRAKHRRSEDSEAAWDAEKEKERRRQKKELRRKEKAILRLAELGLDENGDPLDNYSLLKYPVRELKFTIPGTQEPVALNPIVTLIAVVALWGIVFWSSASPDQALSTLLHARTFVVESFTWIFQGSKAIFFFFLMYTLYRYGNIHLGNKDDKPEFTTVSYFSMIFAGGAGPVFFVFSVAEPLLHQRSNFYVQAGYRSQDEIDMFAINMTLCNWGLSTWLTFCIVAVSTALAVHRFGLPLTFRSCFYPILGAYTWGWMGDAIDGLACILMILGACSMLCSNTIQIVHGFVSLGWVDGDSTEDEITMVQKTTVWFVTFVSIISVISGLRGGIQYMSVLAVTLASFLGFLLLSMDDTKFILNLQIQEVGYHLQTSLFQLNFWTDAFGQLHEGSGRAIDGNAAEQWWMGSWMVLYQAWTSALGAVFGVFVAGLSRGRKLWEVISHCFLAPTGICLLWFCIWGGVGMRQSRQAMELEVLGENYFNDSAYFSAGDDNGLCFEVPQEDVLVDGVVVFTNRLLGVSPVCKFDEAVANVAVLNVLNSYKFPQSFGAGGSGLGPTLTVLYLLGCVVFYVNLSDSASFMVDNLASNGRKNNHWARRMFWASAVGALGTTLLSLGGASALKAIESAIIICALPIAILFCFLLQSTTLFCRAAVASGVQGAIVDYEIPNQPEFAMPVYGGVFNIVEYIVSVGKVNTARIELGMHCPTRFQVVEFVKGLVIPFVSLHKVLIATYPDHPKTNAAALALYTIGYLSWTSIFFASWVHPGLKGLAWTLFVMTGIFLGLVRMGFRSVHHIRSNYVADILVSIFLWPQVLVQLRLYSCPSAPKNNNSKSKEANDNDDEEDVSI